MSNTFEKQFCGSELFEYIRQSIISRGGNVIDIDKYTFRDGDNHYTYLRNIDGSVTQYDNTKGRSHHTLGCESQFNYWMGF